MTAPDISRPHPFINEVTGARAVARITPLMITKNITKTGWDLAALAVSGFAFNVAAAAKPLKVYILAGQSNMEGQAKNTGV